MAKHDNIPDAKKEVYKKLSIAYRVATLTIMGDIIENSPVGDPTIWKSKYKPKNYYGGTFRGNWQASTKEPIRDIIPSDTAVNRQEDPAQTIGKIALTETMYLANNLPYAQALEEGHAIKRPKRWISRIVLEGHKKLQAQVSKIIGGA